MKILTGLTIFLFILVQVQSCNVTEKIRRNKGLNVAMVMIKSPFKPLVPSADDIILSPIPVGLQKDANKLSQLKIRLESAWKLVFTDYCFEQLPHQGVALVNHERKIAIELTTEYPITLKAQVEGQQVLFLFKLNNPEYETIFGYINYKNESSKVVNGIRFMYGQSFWEYVTNRDLLLPLHYWKMQHVFCTTIRNLLIIKCL